MSTKLPEDDEYNWTDASALWQAEHGEPGERTDSSVAWLASELRRRLAEAREVITRQETP